MTRFILSLVIAIGVATSVDADVLDLLKSGLSARNRRDFEAAIDYYTQAIETGNLSPNDLAVVINSRGVAYEVKGETDKAAADFDDAIRLKPDFGEAYINRALIWAKKRQYDRAITDLTEAAHRDPKQAYLALNDRGIVYEEKGDHTRAIEDYGEAIRLKPDYAGSYYNRGTAYNSTGELDKALADFNAAISLKADLVDAYNNRGVLFQEEGKFNKAIADFNRAIWFDASNAIAFGNRGSTYLAEGQYDRALVDFDKAIQLKSTSATGYVNRGVARFYSGRPDAAIFDLTTAVRLQPSDAYAVIWLHLVRERSGLDDPSRLAENAVGVDRAKWPGPVIDLHLFALSPDMVRAAAMSDEKSWEQRTRTCELDFYLGTFDLERGAPEEARRRFQAAKDACLPNRIELAAAKAELERMALKP
jgi:tetratricopeptide (TPR) repeat protein